MGRGTANVKVKAKNLRSGATTEKSFMSNAAVQDVLLNKRNLQFLYKDEVVANFMDPHTFEQIAIPLLAVAQEQEFLKEGEKYSINFLDDEALSMVLPPKMEFEVIETGPSLRGNSATNIYKDAVLDSGLKVKVPLFVRIGDTIVVDTRTGKYHEKRRSAS